MKLFVRIFIGALLAAILVFTLGACGEKPSEGPRVFGTSDTGVTLNADNTFTASLYHGVAKAGTYTESTGNDGVIKIVFTVDGAESIGAIYNNVLTIPPEWADAHGHGSTFALQQ